ATPPAIVLVASGVAPSLKVTVPAGVPAPGEVALLVAVNVTDWPNTVGFVEEISAVLVFALLIVWVSAEEVLPLKPASPLYTALIECDPTASEVVAKVATPPLMVLVTSGVAPS